MERVKRIAAHFLPGSGLKVWERGGAPFAVVAARP
jgi:hypothetical protein